MKVASAQASLGGFRPYLEYRDSGVEWLGKIPAHWAVKKWRYCCQITEGQVAPDDSRYRDRIMIAPNHIESNTGRILFTETADEQGAISGKYLVRAGDLIYSKIRPALNKACIAAGDWLCSADMYPVKVFGNELRPEFLLYFILSEPFVRLMVDESMRVAMPKVNRETIATCPVPIPARSEQVAIASFLDQHTAKIDALVAKKERLIELLQEKRAALITRAVTKGLNPNVPMKDSEVEWLRQIPRNWEVKRIKYLVHQIVDTEHKTAPFYPEGQVLVVRTSNVRNGRLDLVDAKFTDPEGYEGWTRRGKPQPGDILFTREAPAGEACVVPDSPPLCLGQRMVLFRVNKRLLDGRFGVCALYGGLAQEFVQLLSQGATVAHFNMADIGNIPVLVPPLREQSVIADHVDRQSEGIDRLVLQVQRGIDRLKELRAALVCAAVMGKIDVRGEDGQNPLAPALPVI